MAFTPLQANVKNIEGLGTDKPNADLNMSGLQLRQRFDKAVADIKDWINNTFLAEISGIDGAANIGSRQIPGLNATNVQNALSEIYEHTGDVADESIVVSKLADDFKLPTDKIADGAVESTQIADGAVTQSKLAADAKYSTVKSITADYTLSEEDIGGTIVNASTGEAAISVTTDFATEAPVGAEFAIFRNLGATKITFTGVKLLISGETAAIEATAEKAVSIASNYTLVAVKKLTTDSWLITGNVEVEE